MRSLTRTSTLFLEELRLGHSQAWASLDRRYRSQIGRIAGAMGLGASDIEDVVQETMLQVSRDLGARYRRTLGRLRWWIGAIARRRAIDILRKRRRAREVELGAGAAAPCPPASGPDLDLLGRAMERLRSGGAAAQSVEVFERLVRGEPPASVAAALGAPTQSVYVIRSRMLARLRRIAGELEP